MTPDAIKARAQRLFLVFGKPDVVCVVTTNQFGKSEKHEFNRAEIEALN